MEWIIATIGAMYANRHRFGDRDDHTALEFIPIPDKRQKKQDVGAMKDALGRALAAIPPPTQGIGSNG